MSHNSDLLKNLTTALEILAGDDVPSVDSDGELISPELVARFQQMMRRMGNLEGRICSIYHAKGCYWLRGFRPGNWTLRGQRWTDLEDDANPETGHLKYEVVQVGVCDEGPDGETEIVHVVCGMDCASEADQFFDAQFIKGWDVTPSTFEGDANRESSTCVEDRRFSDPNSRIHN